MRKGFLEQFAQVYIEQISRKVNFWVDVLAHLATAEGEIDLMDVVIITQPQPSISSLLIT